MSTLYERRVEQEWRLLEAIAKGNPDLLENPTRCVEVDSALFRFRLQQTQALIQTPTGLHLQDLHDVVIYFPRFFPSVPIEASLLKPVFHPNVHPETGFVCLWNRFSPGDTVVEAITQLQRVITWEL